MSTPIGYPNADEFAVGTGPTASDTFPIQRADFTTLPATASRFAILHDLPGKPVSEFSATLDREGVQNMSSLLSDCIASYTAAGNPVLIGPGLYLNASSLFLVSDAQVLLSPRATLRRNFSTLGFGAHITQADITTTKISNVLWRGGRIDCTNAAALTGNVFCLNFDDSELSDFYIGDWPDNGRAFLLYGDRNRIHDFEALSQFDGGGVRLDGCKDTIVSNFRVYCGDDCLMFAANQNAASPLSGIDTERNQYVNGTARSWNGRPCVSTMERTGSEPGITNNVQDNAFIGIRGFGRRAYRANNSLSSGKVRRIHLIDCHFDCREDTVGSAAAISITTTSDGAGVEDISFLNCTVLEPYLSAVEVNGDARDIRFKGCFFDAPRTDRETVRVDGTADVLFEDCIVEGRLLRNAVRIGHDAAGTARFFMRRGEVRRIANDRYGLRFVSCAAGGVENVRFTQDTGATTASAIIVLSGAQNVVIGRNDYANIDDTTKVVWTSVADNSGCRVDEDNILTISANTTARVHQSGTTFIQTATGSRIVTLPVAATGMSFTLVQENTGAAVFSAVGSDTIRIPGGVSSAGGTITSSSQGAYARLEAVAGKWVATAIGGTWTPA